MHTPKTSQRLGPLLKRHNLLRAEVADALSVSEDTVDNWCSGRSSLKPSMLTDLVGLLEHRGISRDELGDLVRAEASAAGFDLDAIATYANGSSTWHNTVVVLLSDPRYTSQTSLLSGVWDALGASSHLRATALCDWSNSELHLEHLRSMCEYRPAAVVILSQSGETDEASELRHRMLDRGVRVLSCRPTDMPAQTRIDLDERRVTQVGVDFLVELGHRRIGSLFVSDHPVQQERFAGFEAAMRRHSLSTEPGLVRWAPLAGGRGTTAEPVESSGLTRAATYLVRQAGLTAILAPSDTAAVALLSAMNREGLVCPDDVSLLAIRPCGRTDSLLNPPVTHVVPPYYEIGRLAGRAVMDPNGMAPEFLPAEVEVLHDCVICSRIGGTCAPATA